MYKNKYIKTIIFLVLLTTVFLTLISATSAVMYEPTKKYDSGTKIIKINKEKFKVTWNTEQVIDRDKKKVDINYQSMRNKKISGYLYIELTKISKNKMYISKESSSMILSTNKVVKTKYNTNKYYLKKLKPKILNLTKTSILNKRTLKFNNARYVNKTFTDSKTNKTQIVTYKMNWKVYYYAKTSSIEIIERYTELNKSNNSSRSDFALHSGYYFYNPDQEIRIDKFFKGKLKMTILPYIVNPAPCSGSSIYYKYVKTKLSPKQYYLKVYKNKLETKKL